MAAADPDLPLRQAAVARARRLAQDYDDLVPLARLREGFAFDGARVSFGSFQRGIHRAQLQRCAIHHLAFARNVLGIDPAGVVHIARGRRGSHDSAEREVPTAA